MAYMTEIYVKLAFNYMFFINVTRLGKQEKCFRPKSRYFCYYIYILLESIQNCFIGVSIRMNLRGRYIQDVVRFFLMTCELITNFTLNLNELYS